MYGQLPIYIGTHILRDYTTGRQPCRGYTRFGTRDLSHYSIASEYVVLHIYEQSHSILMVMLYTWILMTLAYMGIHIAAHRYEGCTIPDVLMYVNTMAASIFVIGSILWTIRMVADCATMHLGERHYILVRYA